MDVSVSLLNYNGGPLLQECVRSLVAECGRLNVELFLVDNASSDGSFEPACKLARELALQAPREGRFTLFAIQNGRNVGFAGGNNVALRQARGRFILLLNPDATLCPGSLEEVIRYMDGNPEVGICGPRVMLPSGRLDAPCRRTFKTPSTYLYKQFGLSKLFPGSRRFGKYYLSYLPEDQLAEVDSVIGAFLMIRREAMEQVGLLDERYFMYCEDEDWCFQAKKAGWKVVYYPKAQIVHRKGGSSRAVRSRMTFQFHKSIFRFHRKNMAPSYPAIVNGLVYLGIGWSLLGSVALVAANGLAERPDSRRDGATDAIQARG